MPSPDAKVTPADAVRVKKRSLTIAGHRTSLSLEEAFWQALKRLAKDEGLPLAALVRRIDAARAGNLSSAVRVYVLRRLEEKAATTRPDP